MHLTAERMRSASMYAFTFVPGGLGVQVGTPSSRIPSSLAPHPMILLRAGMVSYVAVSRQPRRGPYAAESEDTAEFGPVTATGDPRAARESRTRAEGIP